MLFFSSKFLPLKITLWGDCRRQNLKKKIGLKWFQMVYSARNVKKIGQRRKTVRMAVTPPYFLGFTDPPNIFCSKMLKSTEEALNLRFP